MVDITMCDNKKCDLRYDCYRATAEPSDYQSWEIFEPNYEGKCEFFVLRVEHTRKADKAADF